MLNTTTIPSITLQELVDLNYKAFVVDEEPFGYDSSSGACLYIGPNGERCAIGIGMPKDLNLKDANEIGSVEEIARLAAQNGDYYSDIWSDFEQRFAGIEVHDINALQNIHDEAALSLDSNLGLHRTEDQARYYMKTALREYAQRRNLLDPARDFLEA